MRKVEFSILRMAMLSVVSCVFVSRAESLPEQVRSCFERQYAQQLQDFTIPYRIEVSNVKPDGDEGLYIADVIVVIAPTSMVYKTIIEPKDETTWTAPHIADDIDESLLPMAKRDEMNARIQRFLLTDFTVVVPVADAELDNYLKSTARFKVDSAGTDEAKVVGSGNEGKINFSGVRFFELHSASDVSAEKVFVPGTASYEQGKKRHFKKRFEIGTACASINENAGFVKALQIMETNSTAVADETLSIYTRDMGTPKLCRLREQSRGIREAREKDTRAIRHKHRMGRGKKGSSGAEGVEERDAEFGKELKSVVEARQKELSEVYSQIAQEHRNIHNAIRKEPQKYIKEPKARFDASLRDFNTLVK